MSHDLKPVQVRLTADAMQALKLLADLEEKDYGEKARELLTRALLGEAHAAKIQAERFARALTSDSERQRAITPGRAR